MEIGDHVLDLRATDHGHKLHYKCFGSHCIEEIYSLLVYIVIKFNGTDQQRMHITWLTSYSPELKDPEILKVIMHWVENTTAKLETVESIVVIVENVDRAIKVRVR